MYVNASLLRLLKMHRPGDAECLLSVPFLAFKLLIRSKERSSLKDLRGLLKHPFLHFFMRKIKLQRSDNLFFLFILEEVLA